MRLALFALLVALVSAGGAQASSIKDELASRTRVEGLGIAWLEEAGEIKVQHFGRTGLPDSLAVPGLTSLYDIEGVSQTLLGSLAIPPGAEGAMIPADLLYPRFALFRLHGPDPAAVGLRRWPRSASISYRGKKSAGLFIDPRLRRVSLQYGDLSWTSVRSVYSLDLADDAEHLTVVNYVEQSFGWSPDARWLVYSKQGDIYIFDTQTSSKRPVARGSDPSWSPDGKFVAYRSPQHALMLYVVGDGTNRAMTNDV